jgi:hypothetical protein
MPSSLYWIISLFLLEVLVLSGVNAGSVPQGGLCSADNNYSDPATHRLLTECNDKTFCSAPVNGSCTPKKCVRNEYPLYVPYESLALYTDKGSWLCRRFSGYLPGEIVPPRCPHGTFCPDEGNGCKALLAIEQSCQQGRDEQCAPPPNWAYLASGLNFNGSLCLQEKCRSVCLPHILQRLLPFNRTARYANMTASQPCQIENTTYLAPSVASEQVVTNVIRDNCRTPELFCNAGTMLCESTKLIGNICQTDGECKTVSITCSMIGPISD